MKIGIFDSGVGGLTFFKALKKKLYEYDFVYLADSARSPYGEKTAQEIYQYTKEAVDFLFLKKCQLIILACNTASALALRKIQKKYLPKRYPSRRVLGVVVPNIEIISCGQKNKNNKKPLKIGLIATNSTINSRVYEKELAKFNNCLKLFFVACPELVPLIENENSNKKEIKTALKKYLAPLKRKKIKTLILGCTHYPLIKKQIKIIAGSKIKIVDTSEKVAQKTVAYLKKHPEIKSNLTKNRQQEFFTTGDLVTFKRFLKSYLQTDNIKIKKIKLK